MCLHCTFSGLLSEVLNKAATSDVPNMDPVRPLSSVSTTCAPLAPTPVRLGTKRRHETDLDLCDSEPGVDDERERENVPEAAMWQEQTIGHKPSQNTYCEEQFEEIQPPQRKRRLTAFSSLPGDSQPLKAWSQDPLFTYSQYSEGEFYPKDQKTTSAEDSKDSEPQLLSLQGEEAFALHMDAEATTSTQKSFKHIHSSLMEDEKENSSFLSSESPSKCSTPPAIERFSNNWTDSKTASPRKRIPAQTKADKEDHRDSQFKRTKPSSSPFKKPQLSCRTVDEDSLAMLFTQDSEGFRVIAHRGVQDRSPLKDQSNRSTGTRTCMYRSPVEEREEMLFTQDSQGNLVIKH